MKIYKMKTWKSINNGEHIEDHYNINKNTNNNNT